MKRSSLILLLGLCLSLALFATAQADFLAQVYNTESLNIRSGPDLTFPWLGSIPRNGQVRVVGESGNWYQVITLDGSISGYMSKSYLQPVGEIPMYTPYNPVPTATPVPYYYPVQTAAPAPYYEWNGGLQPAPAEYGVVDERGSLNIRSGPGTQYGVLCTVRSGEWLLLSGVTGDWYRVTLIDTGVSGYANAGYIKTWSGGSAGSSMAVVQNPAGTRFLNLRTYPSYDAQALEILYTGDVCTVLEHRTDGWVYVMVYKNNETLYGYVRGEYLIYGGGGTGTDATVNTVQNGGRGGSLNLRSGPSTAKNVLIKMPNGSGIQVYLKGSKWWQVGYNGLFGFVDKAYVSEGIVVITPTPFIDTGIAYVQTGNSGTLNLREQANQSAKVLGRYENGTQVAILQRGTGWCYVQVNGQVGYMMTKYLSISGSTSTKTVVNNNGGTYVNLRTSPNKKSNNVNQRVPVGMTVTLLSWGEVWSQVSYNGYSGYMMSWFLK